MRPDRLAEEQADHGERQKATNRLRVKRCAVRSRQETTGTADDLGAVLPSRRRGSRPTG